MSHVLAALTDKNRLIMTVAMSTGLRIGDVCALTTDKLAHQRATVHEQKTGKTRRIYWPLAVYQQMRAQAGKNYVFEGRKGADRHHTRQAVWADVKRAARAFRIKENIAPHTTRKMYAVERFKQTGDLGKVQAELNHSDASVTLIYAIADVLTSRKGSR